MKRQIPCCAGVLLTLTLAGLPVSAADSSHRFIVTDDSPARAALPFSDAVEVGDTLYVSGTLGLNPTDKQVPTEPKIEAKQMLEAMQKTLQAAGFDLDDLVSVQIFCTNLEFYGSFNDVYRAFFHDHFPAQEHLPARAFIGVNQLVRGAHFEIMATAVKHGAKR